MAARWSDYLKPDATLVMGVLNVTPDSFSDGGLFSDVETAVEQAHRLIEEGADILDIGGQSTRPGARPITPGEEVERVLPVLERLARETSIPLSIDTFRAEVADRCLAAGAVILNDVCGLRDPEMCQVAARRQSPVVLMHMLGTPQTMQREISYNDVVDDLKSFFERRVREAEDAGVREIMIDPGIGFGKTVEHNLEVLRRLEEFTTLGRPLLVGPSRKSFIGAVTGRPVDDRVDGTIAALVIASMRGADVVRVHDVGRVKQALMVAGRRSPNVRSRGGGVSRMKSFDKVILRDVRARAKVGVSEQERAEPQDVLFDVELHLDLAPAGAADDLSLTPDYVEVPAVLRRTAGERPYHLLETMAEAVASGLLRGFGPERVMVRVRKADLRDADGPLDAAIEITRLRHA